MSVNDASPYPRDFFGYGGNPLDPKWPGNARIAGSIVVKVEAVDGGPILSGITF